MSSSKDRANLCSGSQVVLPPGLAGGAGVSVCEQSSDWWVKPLLGLEGTRTAGQRPG